MPDDKENTATSPLIQSTSSLVPNATIIGMDNDGNWIGRMEKPAHLIYKVEELETMNAVSINKGQAAYLIEILKAYLEISIIVLY